MKIVNYKKKEIGHLPMDYPEKSFNQLLAFQGYGFNKSHATSYSYYAAIQLYLKKHYLIEFMCGILDQVDRSDESKGIKLLDQRVKYCYSHGLRVNAPLVNYAQNHWIIKNNELYASISNIKGLGDKEAFTIMQNRPYTGIKDFMDKTQFAKSKFETLLFAGCFDEFGDRQTLYNWYYNVYTQKPKKKVESNQMTLDFLLQEEPEQIENIRHFTVKQLKDLFFEYNGFQLRQNVLKECWNYLQENKKVKTITQVLQKKVKYPIMLCRIESASSFVSRVGKQWTKLSVSDGLDEAEIMMSTSKYQGLKGRTLKNGNIVVIPVAVTDSDMLFLGNTDKIQIKVLKYG